MRPPLATITLAVNIIVEKDGKGYYASSPSFEGVHAYGDTKKEALQHLNDVIICYTISLMKHNEPIPCSAIIEKHKLSTLRKRHAIQQTMINVPLQEAYA